LGYGKRLSSQDISIGHGCHVIGKIRPRTTPNQHEIPNMAVKKIYSDYQIQKDDDIRWLQIRIAELKCLDDDYFIAQRNVYNKQKKEEWDNQMERIQKYTKIYDSEMNSPYEHVRQQPLWMKQSTLVIYYSQYYSID
jgi:hypothetical protein